MKRLLRWLILLASTVAYSAEQPPIALHFPAGEFEAFVALSEEEFDTSAQWTDWVIEHQGRQNLPSAPGHYLAYTNDSILGSYNVFFGPYPSTPALERDRLAARVKASAKTRPSLIGAEVHLINPDELARVKQLGPENWARSMAMGNERSERAISQLAKEVESRRDQGLSDTDRIQLLAARNADILGVRPIGALGQTLGAEEVADLDLQLGWYVASQADPTLEIDKIRRRGMNATTVETLFLSLSNSVASRAIGTWGWVDDATAGWAEMQVKTALYPNGVPESLSPEQTDVAIRELGRILPASAARRWGLSPAQILAETPSQRELERVADRLQRHGASKPATMIQSTLADTSPSIPDSKDVASALMKRFFLEASHPSIPKQDVIDGREAVVRASKNLPGKEIAGAEIDRWLENGASNQEVQRIANVAQRLIGDMPMIQAIGRSSRSVQPTEWSKEEVNDLLGRIGKAERQARTAEALDENHDANIDIAVAATEGAKANERKTLAEALGQAAGAPPAKAASKGEELLQEAGANPSGGVTSEQAASAAEAAASEGGQVAAGEPGDANNGGTGDRGGSGAIPVESLPVLEMIARLIGQYFGVEAYLKQAALLVYMFAGDVVEDLVAELKGLNDAFGDDLNDIAQDVNALLDAMGPYMGDIGALADKAVEQGIEKATVALGDLAVAKFEEAAIDELKRQIAGELGVDPSVVDLEGALSMASDFSMEKLTALAESAVENAARNATERLLTDAGLPPDVLSKNNWDAAGELVLEELKQKATSEVSRRLGIDAAIADDITNLANSGNWTEVGNQLVVKGRKRAIAVAEKESGLPHELIQDPMAVPDKLNQVIRDAGSVALLLGNGAPKTTKELMEMASSEPSAIAGRIIDMQLEDFVSRNRSVSSAVSAYQEGGLDGVLQVARSDASAQLKEQTDSIESAVALATGVDDPEILDAALEELSREGILDITESVTKAIKRAPNPGDALKEHVFDWASSRWTLKFESDRPCRQAVDARDAVSLRITCGQWLDELYGDSEQPIEAELSANPTLIRSVRDNGDRDALAQALLQYAMQSGSEDWPSELQGAGWQQVSASGLDGAITQWSTRSAAELKARLSPYTNPAVIQSVSSAVQRGNFDEAAEIVFQNRTNPTVRDRLPETVISALKSIEDKKKLLNAISEELRNHAAESGLEAIRRDPDFGGVAELAVCVAEGKDELDCQEHAQAFSESALNVGLADQDIDLRNAIIKIDPALAAASQRAEIEASIQSALDGESLTAAQCFPANDPGCVFRETQLIPGLQAKFPDLSEEAARELVADSKVTLQELKGFAAGAVSDDALVSELSTSAASLERFASTPSVLNDPDAQHQLKQSVLAESLRSVVGERASGELLSRMSRRDDVPPEGHCVDVLVRAFIPSAELSKNNPIFPVPGADNKWMIPGPLAQGYKQIPLSARTRAAIGEPSPSMLSTCYVGDNRGYSNKMDVSSRVWLRFTMHVGESAFEIARSSIRKGTDESHSVHCETGEALETGRADSKSISVEPLPASDGIAGASIVLAGQNPLIPKLFSPLLELDGTFTYSRNSLTVNFSGTREAFPAYEAYARLNGGDWQTIFASGPEKDASAFSIADYNILNTKLSFSSSAELPGLSSACRVPQDDVRRHSLRRAMAAAFKKSTNHCVTFTEVMKMAADRSPNLMTYLEDLRLILVGSDALRRTGNRGPYYIGSGLTNDTGFKLDYVDSSPQIEHAMWGIYASKGVISLPGLVGGVGAITETAQGIVRLLGLAAEEDRYEGMSVDEIVRGVYADSALYAVADDFGSRLTPTNYRDSHRIARQLFCEMR